MCRIRLDALTFWEAYCRFCALLQREYVQVPRDAACMCGCIHDELRFHSFRLHSAVVVSQLRVSR